MSDKLDYEALERELRPLDDDEIGKMLRVYAVEDNMLTTSICPFCGAPAERKEHESRREALIEALRLQLCGSEPWSQLCMSCAIERCRAADIHDDLDVGGYTKGMMVPGRKDGRACHKCWSAWLDGDNACYVAESAIQASENEGRFISKEEAEKIGWHRGRLIEMCGGRIRLAELVLERAAGQEPQDVLSALAPSDLETVELREALDTISCHKVRFASAPISGRIAVAEIWTEAMEESYLAFDADTDLDEDEIMLLAHRHFSCIDEFTQCKTVSIAEFCAEHTDPCHWRYYPLTAEQLEDEITRVVDDARKGGEQR